MTCRAQRASIACWDSRSFTAVMTQHLPASGAGASFLNLIAQPAVRNWSWWGRVIFYHSDVDALYQRLIAAALLLQQSLLPTWEECPPNGGNHPEARSRARAFPRMPCM
jgi:hypothetical protein